MDVALQPRFGEYSPHRRGPHLTPCRVGRGSKLLWRCDRQSARVLRNAASVTRRETGPLAEIGAASTMPADPVDGTESPDAPRSAKQTTRLRRVAYQLRVTKCGYVPKSPRSRESTWRDPPKPPTPERYIRLALGRVSDDRMKATS